MDIRCRDCGSSQFRRSHLRLTDLRKLVLGRYPVRCAACMARGFVPIPAAFSDAQKPSKRNAR
ncbi:hypothetical protein DYQ86_06425 [Acidobacteria bacterium AB60]|nr:hypothetical protein DYQ86_06425 [Acidobacteria bacterium AB60]